jgi:hypothetical protein
MTHPRGTIAREVLGVRRLLRAPLAFPGDYELESGQPFVDFMNELAALQENPFSYNAPHLLAALKVLCAGGGNPIGDEDLAGANFADLRDIIQAVEAAFTATGLLVTTDDGAEKKMAPSRKSRGGSGRR